MLPSPVGERRYPGNPGQVRATAKGACARERQSHAEPSYLRALASVATILLLAFADAGTQAQDRPTIVPILSCPIGCGAVEGNTILGAIMAKNGEPVMIAAQETLGYMYNIRHATPEALTQQLIDGTTDVAVTGFGTDPSQSYHLITGPLHKLQASGKKLFYIPMEQSAIDKVNAKFGTTFVTKIVKAGTMPGQDEDLLIGFVRGYKALHPEFPEEVAYNFVKAVHEYAEEMKPLSALWGMLTPEMMVDGLTEENAHPGAIRALKEIGIWDIAKKSTPVTYPAK